MLFAFVLLAATGMIDGKTAIMLSPESIDPARCEVHFVSDRGRGTESRFACGEWFLPGAMGTYLLWLEQGNTISAAPAILRYSPLGGRGAAAEHVMVPAGQVTLASPPDVAGADSLRLIVVERGEELKAFERKVPLDDVKDGRGVRMPAGPLLSGLYDKDGNVLALAPPARVVAGKLIRVAPKLPPRGTGAVLFSLARPDGTRKSSAITLQHGERSLPPDVLHQSAGRLVAIWYSVPAGSAELRFEGSPIPISVSDGKVTTIRRSLSE